MDVDETDLDRLEERFGRQLPAAYREHLLAHGTGEIESHPDYYVELWTLQDIAAVNELPEVGGAFPVSLFLRR